MTHVSKSRRCGYVAGQYNKNNKFNLSMNMCQCWDIKQHHTILVTQCRTVILQNIHAEINFIIFIALSSYLTAPVNFTIVLESLYFLNFKMIEVKLAGVVS